MEELLNENVNNWHYVDVLGKRKRRLLWDSPWVFLLFFHHFDVFSTADTRNDFAGN